MEKLSKAKADLIIKQPFFASLVMGMPIKEDNSIKTFATNGDVILYNRAFLETLSHPELVFVLAHEAMHCVFQHMYRRGTREHNKWNIAADYIINDLLQRENVGYAPKGVLLDPAIVAQGKGTAEGVYDILPDSPKGQPQPGAGEQGGALDDVQDGAQDEATQAQKEAEMRVRVIQAANAAKMQGKLSSGLERVVGQAVKPAVDWKGALRNFLSERAKIDYTYARPKRRFMADDICLPSLSGETMGRIAIAVDCSGSVDERMLAAFAAEINAIVQDVKPSALDIFYFDSDVLSHETYTDMESAVVLKRMGGGGTAFSPIFRAIDEMSEQPVACVVLTDLCCSDFGPQPSFPVLWASTAETKAPWGNVLELMRGVLEMKHVEETTRIAMLELIAELGNNRS